MSTRSASLALCPVGSTGDDGAAYGVEVRSPDGRAVEVALDTNFKVIGSAGDDDGPNDRDSDGG